MHTAHIEKGKLYIDGKLIAEDIDTISDDELKDVVSKAVVTIDSNGLANLIENCSLLNHTFSEGLNRSIRRHHASYEETRYKRPKKNSKNYF